MISRKEAISIGASAAMGMLFPTAAFAGNGEQKQDGSGGNCDMTCLPYLPSPGTIVDKSLLIEDRLLKVQPGMTARNMIDLIGVPPCKIEFTPDFAIIAYRYTGTIYPLSCDYSVFVDATTQCVVRVGNACDGIGVNHVSIEMLESIDSNTSYADCVAMMGMPMMDFGFANSRSANWTDMDYVDGRLRTYSISINFENDMVTEISAMEYID